MIRLFDFTYTDEQWVSIRTVVRDRLGVDADQIECQYEYREVVLKQCFHFTGMRSLRNSIEGAAQRHILSSAKESQRSGHKARIKQLTALRNSAKAMPIDFRNIIAPVVTVEGASYRSMLHLVDQLHKVERAAATLVSVIEASIAAQRPQTTANTSKAGRDRFWSEMLAIWTSIGGEATGTAPAEFLVATSKPVFERVRAIGGYKTTASMPHYHNSVVEWLRLHAKARRAATS